MLRAPAIGDCEKAKSRRELLRFDSRAAIRSIRRGQAKRPHGAESKWLDYAAAEIE
jgi:hypothetical protein